MDGINLTFNANIANLQRLGLDPTTSEGKEKLIQLFLKSIACSLDKKTGEWFEQFDDCVRAGDFAPLNTMTEEDSILREFLADS
jgi:hypothetical protein